MRERERCELRPVERPDGHGGGKNANEHESADREGIKRQLHRAVLLVGRSPDRDQKIFWDDDEFVEDEEKKKIGAQKNPVGTGDDEEETEKEYVRPFVDVQRKQDCADRGQA